MCVKEEVGLLRLLVKANTHIGCKNGNKMVAFANLFTFGRLF